MISAGGSTFKASTSGNFRKLAEAFMCIATDRFDMRRRVLLTSLNERVLERTPVWEGETIVNWTWSLGTPATARLEAVDDGPTGHTSGMALGEEPRRAANEQAPRISLEITLAEAKGRFDTIWLTNNADTAVLVEIGGAPTVEGSRAPSGALRVALRELAAGFLH